MITDDQVAVLFAQSNPVPTIDALEGDELTQVGHGVPTQGTENPPSPVDSETEAHQRSRRFVPLLIAAALTTLLALPLLLLTGGPASLVSPGLEDEAVQTVEGLFASLTAGDVEGAMSYFELDAQTPMNRQTLAFFAALPGTKTLADCSAEKGPAVIVVTCSTNYNGPLMRAMGEHSVGVFSVKDGLLTTMFIPGYRDGTAAAFFEYASATDPESFDVACAPESYPADSVRLQSSGFAFTGPCGELWARVAEDAATWVGAGRPPLGDRS